MKLAINQPYLFPFIGYFQLIASVDAFVFYDDVNYIKQGWINRNYIRVADGKMLFAVPLQGATSFAPINETRLDERQYPVWRSKFLKTLNLNYRKAPCFEPVYALVEGVLQRGGDSIGALAAASVAAAAAYLGIGTRLVMTSAVYGNAALKGPARVLDICVKERADAYHNTIAGRELYTRDGFEERGIRLRFLVPREIRYRQFGDTFVPWLSIIDVLMFNPVDAVRALLLEYDFE